MAAITVAEPVNGNDPVFNPSKEMPTPRQIMRAIFWDMALESPSETHEIFIV
jgi:hypothetical protein